MKKIIKKVIGGLAYHIKSNRPVQLFGDDPRELPYLKNLRYSVANLPTEGGAGWRFYSVTGDTCHPCVYALLKSWSEVDQEKTMYKIKKTYSDLVTYSSPKDYLGFEHKEVFSRENHPYEFTYPWSVVLPVVQSDFFSEYAALDLFDRMFVLELSGPIHAFAGSRRTS